MKKPKCPKCKYRRYRNVGEIASINEKTYKRTVVERIVECMRCEHVYAR